MPDVNNNPLRVNAVVSIFVANLDSPNAPYSGMLGRITNVLPVYPSGIAVIRLTNGTVLLLDGSEIQTVVSNRPVY